MNKADLRKQFLAQKNLEHEQSNSIMMQVAAFIEKYDHINGIGIYIHMTEEVDLSPLLVKFPHKRFSTPKIKDGRMYYVPYVIGAALSASVHFSRHLEPDAIEGEEVVPGLLFVPGLAFDVRGYRLGRGFGHFDKYLAQHDVLRVGLCTRERLIEHIPDEPHDKKMHHIVTDEVVINLC